MGDALSDLAAPATPIISVSSVFSSVINSIKVFSGIYTASSPSAK